MTDTPQPTEGSRPSTPSELREWMEARHTNGVTINLADVFEEGRQAGLREARATASPRLPDVRAALQRLLDVALVEEEDWTPAVQDEWVAAIQQSVAALSVPPATDPETGGNPWAAYKTDHDHDCSTAHPIDSIEDAWNVIAAKAYVADGTSESCRWCHVFRGLDHAADCPLTIARAATAETDR